MDVNKLRALLTDIQAGRVDVDQAMRQLRDLPYDDIGYAQLDYHRSLRQGIPEVVCCQGQTSQPVTGIRVLLWQRHDRVAASRAAAETSAVVPAPRPQAR